MASLWKIALLAVIGFGTGLLFFGVLAWSVELIASGSGLLMVGVVSYSALKSEHEARKLIGASELALFRKTLELLLEEFELADERVVFFSPSSIGGEPAVLISHKKARSPRNPGRIPKRLLFEYHGYLFLRLPSILSMVPNIEVGSASRYLEVEPILSSILKEYGLASDIKVVEKPDGVAEVHVRPRRGIEVDNDPRNIVVNFVGSIVSESLNKVLELHSVERGENGYYVIRLVGKRHA